MPVTLGKERKPSIGEHSKIGRLLQTGVEWPVYCRGVPDFRDVQSAVESLAAELSCSVLIEDPSHQPLWWSIAAVTDEVQRRTILERTVASAGLEMVQRLRLPQSTIPVRTPEIPEIGMMERWCLTLRSAADHHGYLWIIDPERTVGEERFAEMAYCAEIATSFLAHEQSTATERQRQRQVLLDRLLRGRDEEAAQALIDLDRLPHDAEVVVRSPATTRGWSVMPGMSAEVWSPAAPPATSGAPLPLADLQKAVLRTRAVTRVLAAGALLSQPTWDHLGAWRLIVEAPADLEPGDLHPGVPVLARRAKPDLVNTARAVLDHGGDVAAAARSLHLHRTTLYYRLDRIADLIGVDLRTRHARTELHLALWLDAYRQADT